MSQPYPYSRRERLHSPLSQLRRRRGRTLIFDALEDRRMLATVTVSNALDVVNGDTTSIAALVSNNGGDGISLREAVLAANATSGADDVHFNASLSGQTITLSGTELQVTEALVIDASSLAAGVTVHGNSGSRIINITATSGDFGFTGLTFTGGLITGTNANLQDNTFNGGAIRSVTSGQLTIDQSTITGNSNTGLRARAGALYSLGPVTITNSTVTGNNSTGMQGRGGAIFAGGEVTITQSTFTNNNSSGGQSRGGAIDALGTMTISDSTFTDNSTSGNNARGGAISGVIVNISNSVITGNRTTGATARGGAIFTNGALTIADSTVSNNHTEGPSNAYGGAIGSDSTVSISQSTLSGNYTMGPTSGGGALYATGAVTVNNSSFTENYTRGMNAWGGAVFTPGGLTLTGSTMHANYTTGVGAHGGAIDGGPLVITNSTISDNYTTADTAGGGAIVAHGDLTLIQSTVSGNYTEGNQGGGGIWVFGAHALTIDRSTITDNHTINAISPAGGLLQASVAATSVSNSIIAGNTSGTGGADWVPPVALVPTVNYSLIGVADGLTFDGNIGNLTGTAASPLDPLLGSLADNGGPTRTHALLSGSPAIDVGDPGIAFNPSQFDQRGAPNVRVSDGDGAGGPRIDMGAYEVQGSAGPTGDFNNDGLFNLTDIDLLVGEIVAGTNNPAFDLTGDGLVNLGDRDAWLAIAGGINLGSGRVYLLGDANLDGVVDGSDFGVWNANKFTSAAMWSRADFNADGVVDGSDFGIWNGNKFTSSDGAAQKSASSPSVNLRTGGTKADELREELDWIRRVDRYVFGC